MNVVPTKIHGAYLLQFPVHEDGRGWLARVFDTEFLRGQSLFMEVEQSYVCYTKHKGTVRGIHWQEEPAAEQKLTRCLQGTIYEVLVDLRKESPTYKRWEGFFLDAKDTCSLFVPKGVGHAFATLQEDVLFLNFSSAPFSAEHERGIRHDDPAFSIAWPTRIEHISKKDSAWPLFKT